MRGRGKVARGALSRNPLTRIGKALPPSMLQSTPIFAWRTKPCSCSRAGGQDRSPRVVTVTATVTAGRAATKKPGLHTQQPLQGSRARTRTANLPFCIEPQHEKGSPSLPNPSCRFGALRLASATACLRIRLLREETVTSGGGASSWHRQLCQKFTTLGWCRGGVTAPRCPSHTHRGPEPARAFYSHRHPARSGGYPTCTSAQAAPEPSAR